MHDSELSQPNPYAPGTSAEGLAPESDNADEAQITFLLTTDDYIAFHNRTYRWGMRKYLWVLIAVVLGLLWGLILLVPDNGYDTQPVVPIQTLIVLTAILVTTPLLSPVLVRRQLRRYYEHITRSMTVVVSSAGLRVHSDVSDLLYRWHGISQVVLTAKHFFIQINRYQSFIVPRRAFPDPTRENTFRDLLTRYGPAARQDQAS